jgi:hypothetical protein
MVGKCKGPSGLFTWYEEVLDDNIYIVRNAPRSPPLVSFASAHVLDRILTLGHISKNAPSRAAKVAAAAELRNDIDQYIT